MKTIIIWSRATDRKILAVFAFLCCILFAAAIGTVIPAPVDSKDIVLLDGFISSMLLALVWAIFRLVRPVRLTQGWVIAEFIAVPVIWACLVTALGIWFSHIHDSLYPHFEEIAKNAALL